MESENGYKTRQRELIRMFVTENHARHFTADDVVAYLRENGSPVGKSTVYRCLERLTEQGTVRRYFLEEGAGACYQYAGGGKDCHQHFHLKCTGCGSLLHVQCDYLCEISAHVLEHHGFTIDHTKTVLYGVCADCAAASKGVSNAN